MNNQRRKSLSKIIADLDSLRPQFLELIKSLDEIKDNLENEQSDEEDSLNNLPESLWESERAEKMEEAINNLGTAESIVMDAIEFLEDFGFEEIASFINDARA
jgi:ABC-type transporter Mla subunit MlaD